MMNLLKMKQPLLHRGYVFIRYSVFILLIAQVFISCKTAKPYAYLGNIARDTVLRIPFSGDQDMKIRKGDKLSLLVTSLNRQEDEIYNAVAAQGGYEVGEEGEIYFQRLGKVNVQGLTLRQVKEKIEQELKPYLKSPLVSVKFTNHKVTVIGQVGKPQILQIPDERISLFDALAESGVSGREAKLSKIIIIRDSSAENKIVRHLSLEDASIFQSPYYYLKPNDVVIVNTDEKMAIQDQERLKIQQILAVVFQATTLSILIYQTFFR